MSLTFGERLAEMEENIQNMAQLLEVLMKAMGLLDENGEWREVELDSAETGETAT